MAIISYTNAEQQGEELCGGNIYVKKPIGLPEDEGLLKSYSNLFYWAHIRTDMGGDINDQSVKGFDILTFVLDGEIEYYDSIYQGWRKLNKGDMQVVKSGNGVIRSERFMPGTSLLRIWVDPNLDISLKQHASSRDYASDLFPVDSLEGIRTKLYSEPGSAAEIENSRLTVKEIALSEGQHLYTHGTDLFVSGFVLEGELKIKKITLRPLDFFIAKEEAALQIEVLNDCRIFIVESPVDPGYPTYAGRFVM